MKHKKWLIALSIILPIIIIIGWLVIRDRSAATSISRIEININTADTNKIIDSTYVLDLIYQVTPRVIGVMIEDFPLDKVYQTIKKSNYVENVLCNIKLDGTLKIDVWARCPLLHIISNDGYECILDTSGFVMPIPEKYNLYIPVAYGNIKTKVKIGSKVKNIKSYTYESKDFTELDKLYYLAKTIKNDEISKLLFWDIYVENQKSFYLYPIVGNQYIRLGDVDQLDDKLKNISIFYNNIQHISDISNFVGFDLRVPPQVIAIKQL